MTPRQLPFVFLLSLVGACTSAPHANDATDADAVADVPPPPRVCRSGATWSPGATAFAERTSDWGLAGLNGTNFGVADLDGDGWPDLVLNQGSIYTRASGHVFMNRPGPNGGRAFVDNTMASQLYAVRGSTDTGRNVSYTTFGDIDNDGDVDVFTAPFMYLDPHAPTDPLPDGMEIMLNDGHGVFTLANPNSTDPAIVGSDEPLTSSAFFFDQDLDGKLDLAIGYWWTQPPFTSLFFGQQPQMFRGDGAGNFADVTTDTGFMLDSSTHVTAPNVAPDSVIAAHNPRPLFGLVMCDVNDDGHMDVVGAAYGRQYNELFLANGNQFSEIGAMTAVGADSHMDYSDDQTFRCYCETHASAPNCAGVPPATTIACPGRGWYPGITDQPFYLGGNTFSYACEDVDNDGDFDLYESNIRHPDVGSDSDPSELIVNDGTPGTLHFSRPGRDGMGLTPPINLTTTDEGGQHDAAFDFDNDGRMDLYLAGSPYVNNRGWIFHQQATGTLQFEWIGAHGNLINSGFDHACPNGTALADFDHDGDLDMVVGTYGCNDPMNHPVYTPPTNQPVRFYENVSNDANWTAIRLVGRGAGGSNRQALGARVRVTAGGVTQMRLVHGSSQNVASEPVALFGLGNACDIDRIEVRWPNGSLTTQTFTGVLANYRVEIREGESGVHYLP